VLCHQSVSIFLPSSEDAQSSDISLWLSPVIQTLNISSIMCLQGGVQDISFSIISLQVAHARFVYQSLKSVTWNQHQLLDFEHIFFRYFYFFPFIHTHYFSYIVSLRGV